MDTLSNRVSARLAEQEAERRAYQEQVEKADRAYSSIYSTVKALIIDVTAEAAGIRPSDIAEIAMLDHFADLCLGEAEYRWNTPKVEVPTPKGPLALPQEATMYFSVDGCSFGCGYTLRPNKDFPFYKLRSDVPFWRGRKYFSHFTDAYIYCKGIAEGLERSCIETEKEEEAISEKINQAQLSREAEIEALVYEIAKSPVLYAALKFIVKIEQERFRADEYAEYLDEQMVREEQAAIERQADLDYELDRLRRDLEDAQR